jgi:hypothetical protein
MYTLDSPASVSQSAGFGFESRGVHGQAHGVAHGVPGARTRAHGVPVQCVNSRSDFITSSEYPTPGAGTRVEPSERDTHGLSLTSFNVPLPKIPPTGQWMVEPLRKFGHVISLKMKSPTTKVAGSDRSTS